MKKEKRKKKKRICINSSSFNFKSRKYFMPKKLENVPHPKSLFFDDQTTSFSLTRFSYFTKYLKMQKIFSKNVFDEIYLVFMTELAIS